MHKTKSISLAVLLTGVVFLATGCPSGPSIQLDGWLYNIYSGNQGHQIAQRTDGGYFVGGMAWYGGEDRQEFVLFIDGQGNLERQQVFPGEYAQASPGQAATTLLTADNSVFVAGLNAYPAGPDSHLGRLRVVKTDAAGGVLWDNIYGDENLVPSAICEVSGGVLVLTLNWSASLPTVELMSIASDGSLVWDKTPLEGTLMNPNALLLAPDGTIAVAGSHRGDDGQDAALLLLNSAGDKVSYNRYSADATEEIWSLELAADGGYYLGGTAMLSNLKRRPYLVKTDANGVFEWDRDDIYAPEGASADVQIWDMVVDDEGYIAMVGDEITVRYIGGTIPVTSGNSFIMRLDGAGNLVWKTDIGGLTYGIDYTQQGTYITTGVVAEYVRVLEFNKNGKLVN